MTARPLPPAPPTAGFPVEVAAPPPPAPELAAADAPAVPLVLLVFPPLGPPALPPFKD